MPVLALSERPTRVVPLIAGLPVTVGAEAIGPYAVLNRVAVPRELVPVTPTRTYLPPRFCGSSSELVAPEIALQLLGRVAGVSLPPLVHEYQA